MTQSISSPTAPPPAPDADADRRRRPRREVILASVCLGTGLVILPALIYAFGSNVLGDYGGGPHIGSFYGDFFRNLGSGTFRTWLIVLTPYLTVLGLRLIFRPRAPGTPPAKEPEAVAPAEPAQPRRPAERREPFVSP